MGSMTNAALAEEKALSYSLEKFKLYETRARYYLVGRSRDRQHWRILKIDRSEPDELSLSEDPVVYTQAECTSVLQTVADGNKSTGGLQLVTKAHGVVGFIKFLECYYMILVTKRRQVGTICGHAIYSIEETALITVPHASVQREAAHSKLELRYKKLLSGVDLTKDFFFSYTYRLMQTLQRNALYPNDGNRTVDTMFVWNAFLTRGITKRLGNTRWTVPLIHGYCSQAQLSLFGRMFTVTLIARRSRHFAGTRYLKRGVNNKGRVANDVETEQLVAEESTSRGHWPITSVVQNRGSIPLFWSQETSKLSPKPDIILQRYDPVYQATQLHFQDLANRYGNPIIILNLIKTVEKRPREMILRREFANAVGYLNQTLGDEEKLKFIHWDFHKYAKSKGANVLTVLGSIAEEALDMTGFFCSGRQSGAAQKASRRAERKQSDVMQTAAADVAQKGSADKEDESKEQSDVMQAAAADVDAERASVSRRSAVLETGQKELSESVQNRGAEVESRGLSAGYEKENEPSEEENASDSIAESLVNSARTPEDSDAEERDADSGKILVVDTSGKHTRSPTEVAESGSLFDKVAQETDQASDSSRWPAISQVGESINELGGTRKDSAVKAEGALNVKGGESILKVEQRADEKEAVKEASVDQSASHHLQSGVLRTNCIDCLDRTNVAQYAFGLAALARQLHALGFISQPKLDPDSGVAGILMDMYQEMGDVLALQYGGSAAHNMVFPERQGLWKATTHSRELLKTIRRYYSNAYTDAEKQDAINLFLGHFIPEENKPALWELDNDYHLHMGHSGESPRETPPSPTGDPRSPPSLRLPVHTFDDPPRLKLTSFDKLAANQAAVRHVRLVREDLEPPEKPKTETAAEETHVLLTGPNWLFGASPDHHLKVPQLSPRSTKSSAQPLSEAPPQEPSTPLLSPASRAPEPAFLLSPTPDPAFLLSSDESLEPVYTSTDDDDWYGSSLLAGSIESSPAYEHYQRLCQVTDEAGLLSDSSSQTELYKTYGNITPASVGLEASDRELEERLAQQFEKLGSFGSLMQDGQEGVVFG